MIIRKSAGREYNTIIGVDTSMTKSGIVVIGTDLKVKLADSISKQDGGVTNLHTARMAAVRFGAILDVHKPDLVVMEDYAFGNTFSLTKLVEIGTVFRMEFIKREIPFILVSPRGLKKFVTGKGISEKAVINKYIYKKWGFDTDDNDIADAYGLVMVGLGLINKLVCTEIQKDVLSKLKILR